MSAGLIFGMYAIMGIFWTWWMFDFKKDQINGYLDTVDEGKFTGFIKKASYAFAFIMIGLFWPKYLFITFKNIIKGWW